MYGEVKKCPEQIEIDNAFFADCDKQFENRKSAAEYYIQSAWNSFYKNDDVTSMKRFNQAWLLDKKNADVYWGFGNLLGKKGEYEKSIKFFDLSKQLNPNNAKFYVSSSTSYGQIFFKTKDQKFLDKAIEDLKKSISLDNSNAQTYANLTAAYSYLTEKDSAQ